MNNNMDNKDTNYISKFGYVVYKNTISIELLDEIKKELTAIPLSDDKYSGLIKKFPVYIETKNKIYIPKMYGISKFGIPKFTKNYLGIEWEHPITFDGTLYDNQKEPVNKLIEECKNKGGGILSLKTGGGKCLALDTPILMYNGNIKMVQDIKKGELLMGDDSTPRKVLSLARGQDEMYNIIPDKGDTYTVNQEHILVLQCKKTEPWIDILISKTHKLIYNVSWWNQYKLYSSQFEKYIDAIQQLKTVEKIHDSIVELPVKDYIKQSKLFKQYYKGYKVPVDFDKKQTSINPYIFGHWIANNTFKKIYRSIPKNYLYNNRHNRLKLLAGIIDAIGNLYQNQFVIIINDTTHNIINDIVYLAQSLGFACYLNKQNLNKQNNKNVRISISGDIHLIPTKIKYNQVNKKHQIKNVLQNDIKVKHIGKNDYYGFTIDGNNRFLLGDFTVTHNTFCALKVISELKLKTLVVVNKITLMKQWEDEINRYLPNAVIGTIQGQKNININDCDIVLSMLQSLSRIDYPDSLFKDFGTVVVDECFVYDTFILTSCGPIKIGDLYYSDILPHVQTFNEYTGKYEWKPILNVFRKQNDKLLAITCKHNDEYYRFYCTYNHLFLTTNGWIEACELNEYDVIISYSKSNMYTTSIVTYIEYNLTNTYHNSYVYDLEVQDNHNYIISSQNNSFGIIVHNCHNTSSQVFSKIFFKLCSKYTIGLSATPQRSDGCENVFKWHLGNIVYQSPNESRDGLQPIIRALTLNCKNYKEIKVINKFKCEEQIQYTSTLSELLDMPIRNELIIHIIKNLISENRKILLLSDRRSHVQSLKKLLDSDLSITFTYGLFIGGMKLTELEKNKSSQCILATYKAFAEGVSEKELNTLLLVSPKKFIDNNNTTNKTTAKKDSGLLNQAVGRIFRKTHDAIHPMIIDLQDNFSIFRNQNKQRNLFYKQHFPNGIFEDAHVHLNHDSIIKPIEYKQKYSHKIISNTESNDILTSSNICLID